MSDASEACVSRGGEPERLAALSRAVRQSTLKRLRRVPEGRESWSPGPGALSFAEVAAHLVEVDRWLFAKLADPSLPGIVAEKGRLPTPDRARFLDLLAELEETGRHRVELLAAMSEADLDRLVPDDRFGGEVPVWWVVVRGNLDHEAHHRGQLALALRLLKQPACRDPT